MALYILLVFFIIIILFFIHSIPACGHRKAIRTPGIDLAAWDLPHFGGLTGLTLDVKATTKWLYTKLVSSEVSSQFKEMMNVPMSKSAYPYLEK